MQLQCSMTPVDVSNTLVGYQINFYARQPLARIHAKKAKCTQSVLNKHQKSPESLEIKRFRASVVIPTLLDLTKFV